LQTGAFPTAHFDVRDDVVAHWESSRRVPPEARSTPRPDASTAIVAGWLKIGHAIRNEG
jgi:hypothetical protein